MSAGTSDPAPTGESRFKEAVRRFDEANAGGPNVELVEGCFQSKELVYARHMTGRLDQFKPNAPEPLRLAARCQHIQRWMIPRIRFDKGRDGYREWRTTLASFHAETAGGILRDVGYADDTVERVQGLLRKERLKADPDVQTLEDVICLVFLEHYLSDFTTQHNEAKLINILRKTWRKMSERGRSVALTLDLEPNLRSLVERAVG